MSWSSKEVDCGDRLSEGLSWLSNGCSVWSDLDSDGENYFGWPCGFSVPNFVLLTNSKDF